MKNISLRMKVLSGVLCTGLVFSATNVTFAAVKEIGNSEVKLVANMKHRNPMDEEKESPQSKMLVLLEAVVKESVDSSIITKDEGDKVLKYVVERSEKKCEDGKKCKKERKDYAKGGLFNELVTEGILTKEKAEALRDKMYSKKTMAKAEELQKGLATLVDNKVLTIEQKNKVEEAIMAAEAQRKEEHKKMRNMNEKEKEEHMKKMKETMIDPIKVLVDNGTITKEQEKEIKKVLPHHHHELK